MTNQRFGKGMFRIGGQVKRKRFDHRGRMVPVDIPISDIDYIWIRDRQKKREVLGWIKEFEELLGDTDGLYVFTGAQQEQWESIKTFRLQMVATMVKKGSTNIIDGMRDPFLVRWGQPEEKWVPLKGNQRLCILRSAGHDGVVPCRIR